MFKPALAATLLLACIHWASAQTTAPTVPRPPVFGNQAPLTPAATEAAHAAREAARSDLERRLEARFNVSGNEVYDKKSDRTWQRCNYGQTWDETNAWCKGVAKQLTVQSALDDVAKNAQGWRLPDLGEMMSMMEAGCVSYRPKDGPPPIFMDVKTGTFYLTTSPHGNAENNMAAQCFGSTGMSSGLSLKYVSMVRLVREGK